MSHIAAVLSLAVLLLTSPAEPAHDAFAVSPAPATPPLPTPTTLCQPTTIAFGFRSGWAYNTPGFMGEDLIIRDSAAWQAFWSQHVAGVFPPPPLPPVDFSVSVVIAVVQGTQSSAGGPYIVISGVSAWLAPTPLAAPTVQIQIVDEETPGPLPTITNPFHIVLLPRACVPLNATVSFRHLAPAPNASLVYGRTYIPANTTDWIPISNATVKLISGAGQPPRITRSGWDGTYLYPNTPAGPYVLDADAPPYCGTPVVVVVPPGAAVAQDFYLTPAPTPAGCQ